MDPDDDATVRPVVKPIHLALQGGGSHGAFTWGVLDRLLEDERLSPRTISGTSAGAMNAVVLADVCAERWLDAHFRDIGRASSLDLATVAPIPAKVQVPERVRARRPAARWRLRWPFKRRAARRRA